ncbi:complement C1q tumor necrosis factor-related protein 3-like [Mya arenaria]|uniref:complement C1q tumor necrosis factor-related protein 3-like n=1 Tax=Mya arenaria TaxID=6604 RepID=UPI0022E2E2BA|nr:complement C1q tumor necrosis factor-related protein 3-like [Mya arenaria]
MATSFIVVLLFIALVGYTRLAEAVSENPTASQIRFLLDEDAALRQKLHTRIQGLRQSVSTLNASIVPCSCPLPTTPAPRTQVSYTGTLKSTMSSLNAASVFNFTGDLINVGAPYTPHDAHFVAPVSGIYGFSLAAYMSPRYYVYIDLLKENAPILHVKTGHYYSGSTNRQVNLGTNFVLTNMTKGDHVWAKYSGGSAYLFGEGVSTFSGFLLYEL